LRKLFNQDDNLDHPYMNIIVKGQDGLFSLVVDEVTDIIDIDKQSIENAPDTINPGLRKYVDSIYKRDQGVVILLNPKKLMELDDIEEVK
jgi:chemotaxis signal transduction protein